MDRELYLHEVVDIVGDGANDYMRRIVDLTAKSGALMGTFAVVGTTGRWPQVMNLHRIGGWDDFASSVERTYVSRRRDGGPALADSDVRKWWRDALQTRSGGFDRILGGADGCPTFAELVADGVAGSVFVHELTTVTAGAGPEHLAAVGDQLVPVANELGARLVGLYEVMFDDTEVVVVWATDVEGLRRLAAAGWGDPTRAADRRLRGWHADRRRHARRWHQELLVPHPDSALAAFADDG